MKHFTLSGLDLAIPENCLNGALIAALETHDYEVTETRALQMHLKPDDRYLELGAGAGYLAAQAARIIPPAHVLGIEANPLMVPAAQANLDRNGAAAAQIRHGAVVADTATADHISFHAHPAFWQGKVQTTGADDHIVAVPALRLGDLLRDHRPSLVMIDIEGAEADFIGYDWPQSVRLVVMETHLRNYSDATVLGDIIGGFFAQGFVLSPLGTQDDTLVFERVSGPYQDPRYRD